MARYIDELAKSEVTICVENVIDDLQAFAYHYGYNLTQVYEEFIKQFNERTDQK